jgi:hypothetical protein
VRPEARVFGAFYAAKRRPVEDDPPAFGQY